MNQRLGGAVPIFGAYLVCAGGLAVALAVILEAALPVFTLIWLAVSGVVLVRHGTDRLGLRSVPRSVFVSTSAICLLGIVGPAVILEPLTKSYTRIIEAVLDEPVVDLAFVGLDDSSAVGTLFTVAYLGGVGLAAEELFFRGVLIQSFRERFGRSVVVWQAMGFVLLNSFILLVASGRDSIVYLVGYTLPLGLVLGWAAERTRSIWPGLFALNVANAAYFFFARDLLLPV